MKQFLSRFLRHETGVAFIEFAMVFPFMFLLLFGGVEVARYILIIQRVEKTAYVLTDIVGQESPANPPLDASIPENPGEIGVKELQTNVFPLFTRLMGVFGDPDKQAVIMSSVINTSSGIRLRWQQVSPIGAKVGSITSLVTGKNPENTSGNSCKDVGFTGETSALLSTMTLGENMIVGEVFYRYEPIAGFLLGVGGATPDFSGAFNLQARTIGRHLFLHPRNGELVDLPPAHPVLLNSDGYPNMYPCG